MSLITRISIDSIRTFAMPGIPSPRNIFVPGFPFQDAAITSSGLNLTDVNCKRDIDFVLQHRDGTTLRRGSLFRARPVKFVVGNWDNESGENVIESVTLSCDYFEMRS